MSAVPTSAGASSGSELAQTAEGSLHSTLNHSQVLGIFSNLGRESKGDGWGAHTIQRQNKKAQQGTGPRAWAYFMLVSLWWLDWIVISGDIIKKTSASVYRQGSQGPKKRRDLFKINWIHESLQEMYNLVLIIQKERAIILSEDIKNTYISRML